MIGQEKGTATLPDSINITPSGTDTTVKLSTVVGNDTPFVFGNKGNYSNPLSSSHTDFLQNPLAATAPSSHMQGQSESTPSPWGTRSFADTVRPTPQRQPNVPIPEAMKSIKQDDFFAIDIDDGIYQ
ncbi:hypothetical protein ACS0TY_003409 [Phlomoides rotata]